MNLELLTQKAVQAAIDAGQLISSYRDTDVDVLKNSQYIISVCKTFA